ncbi:XdhC family protein [Pseudosulfitobacter koreensis]|uniref:XdhC family protein n=1 Tax=Pseudosulfitobacter koreensis TaxID=2968472 RepID=A0ABT1YXR3_9RHOB|nr:XdhC family protein [Pseudosulfitobacter koreense]MCR8825621.1 XdhC family protein [Pseudosulfitobacter koreense]
MDIFENAPELALEWHRAGRGAAMATVVDTWGSAPRRTGAMLVVSGDGEMMGSVSGGCVEGAVVLEAQDALEDGKPRLLEYGVSDGDAFAVGLACGGTIRILVEPVGTALDEGLLEQIVTARAERRQVAYVVDTGQWSRTVVGDGYESRFAMDRSGLEEDAQTFVQIHNPPLRLIVVGAVHIAQALLPMARIAGFDPVVIDPRGAFGSQARFPGETILSDWPDEALDAVGPDARTALVLLTHDPKLDDPALHRALHSKAFYIGALGSKRTHASRTERLIEAGFDADAIARIRGPVGLDIGAASPPEIAVSILAQMVQALRRGA